MSIYANAYKKNPNLIVRVHPLLLSLTEAIDASETNPDISTVSENDERVLNSKFYTSPRALPPLEIHSSGKNGQSTSLIIWLCSHVRSWLLRMHGTCRSGQFRR